MTAIKERPILFSAPMVRAILEGRKTVTRRAVKGSGLNFLADFTPEYVALPENHFCPYGNPGDRLWVRETWYCDHFEVLRGPYLKPDDLDIREAIDDGTLVYAADGLTPYEADQPIWKPSIHMPRWASRILLEITDVRVERLQDISEDQAKAEGCFFTDYGQQCGHSGTGWKDVGICPARAGHQQRAGWAWDKTTSHAECLGSPRWAFANLWNSTGGDWDANPWVWCVEFRRVTP
ncbi:Phage protein [Pseudomonas synxantha]|uniref:hypothetical protein n=1 Tax=Pseudomonas synxantha TaxID=47883 RepID=UPI000F58ACC6|nr:hypothetical protein [Pseudomonas synxantha]AZE73171.1 Phage protein [Pseudomonas synxantha]